MAAPYDSMSINTLEHAMYFGGVEPSLAGAGGGLHTRLGEMSGQAGTDVYGPDDAKLAEQSSGANLHPGSGPGATGLPGGQSFPEYADASYGGRRWQPEPRFSHQCETYGTSSDYYGGRGRGRGFGYGEPGHGHFDGLFENRGYGSRGKGGGYGKGAYGKGGDFMGPESTIRQRDDERDRERARNGVRGLRSGTFGFGAQTGSVVHSPEIMRLKETINPIQFDVSRLLLYALHS